MILLIKLFPAREIIRILFSPNRAGNNGIPTPWELNFVPVGQEFHYYPSDWVRTVKNFVWKWWKDGKVTKNFVKTVNYCFHEIFQKKCERISAISTVHCGIFIDVTG